MKKKKRFERQLSVDLRRQVSKSVQMRAGASEVRSQMLPCWFFITRVMTAFCNRYSWTLGRYSFPICDPDAQNPGDV